MNTSEKHDRVLSLVLSSVQESIHQQTGLVSDCYYREGHGALYVQYGVPLQFQHVIFALPEQQIRQIVLQHL